MAAFLADYRQPGAQLSDGYGCPWYFPPTDMDSHDLGRHDGTTLESVRGQVDRLNFEKSGKADLDKLASLSYRVFGMTYPEVIHFCKKSRGKSEMSVKSPSRRFFPQIKVLKKYEKPPDSLRIKRFLWWRVADSNRRPSACEKMSHSKIIERTGTFKAPVSLSLILSLNAVAVQHMESRRLGLCRIPDPFHEPKPERCSKMIYR